MATDKIKTERLYRPTQSILDLSPHRRQHGFQGKRPSRSGIQVCQYAQIDTSKFLTDPDTSLPKISMPSTPTLPELVR
jgi:hypothetical protein